MKKKTKNRIRNIFIVLVALIAMVFFLRGTVYRGTVSYKDDGGRKNYKIKDKSLSAFIENNLPDEQSNDIESIIDISQKITDRALEFSLESKENDPNKTVLLRRANCVGYAAFTAATGNYLIDKYKLSKVWEARPVKGKLFLLGHDMHKKTKNKSFKDHDFVIFKNKITNREICVDPTIYQSCGIKRITKYDN